jgi:CRP/FNR family transcriptional regulator, cyclic AMP receptor protein
VETLEPIIAKHPFFADLAAPYVGLLVGCAANVRFDAGTYVFREGQEAKQFYLVRRGRIAVEIGAPPHKPLIVDTVEEGDILGWSWLVPPHQWRFQARAVDTCLAIALDGECLRNKCEQNHDLGYELLKRFGLIMARRLDATRLQLLDVYSVRR